MLKEAGPGVGSCILKGMLFVPEWREESHVESGVVILEVVTSPQLDPHDIRRGSSASNGRKYK